MSTTTEKKKVKILIYLMLIGLILPSYGFCQNQAEIVNLMKIELSKNNYKFYYEKKDIPNKVLRKINTWRKKVHFDSYFSWPKYRNLKKFTLANHNEYYSNSNYQNTLPPCRKLIFAANNDKKWMISYYHNEGGLVNTKMLFIDIDHPNYLLVYFHSGELKNKIQLLKYFDKNALGNYETDIIRIGISSNICGNVDQMDENGFSIHDF